MPTFFTADPHFGHINIIEYCHRPFANVQEMDEALIKNWNNVVGQYDTVYILGDFSFRSKNIGEYAPRLGGKKLLIPGNHDDGNLGELAKYMTVLPPLVEEHIGGHRITLCHYAMRTWNGSHRGTWHLHGHSHGGLLETGLATDVGVDAHNYTPISFERVSEILSSREFATVQGKR